MSNCATTKTYVPLLLTPDERLQCAICDDILVGPLQLPCSHRICMTCARELKQRRSEHFSCRRCDKQVEFTNYYHDKAVAKEIDNSTVKCPQCSWTGKYQHFQVHIKSDCKMVEVTCPNSGCNEVVIKSEIENHLQDCQRTSDHYIKEGTQLTSHNNGFVTMEKSTIQECVFSFLGCKAVGNNVTLNKHMKEDMDSHLYYICKYLCSHDHSSPHCKQNGFTKQLLHTDIETVKVKAEQAAKDMVNMKSHFTEVQGKQKDAVFRLNGMEDMLTSIQASITELNRTYEEVSLTLQTLQATSYDGKYIWKIPDITRRRRDALLGKTVSLYSAPFYTDRFGYRLCLRVYLDGDGSGKGHYISYFLTIMKGEYDALLEWPFQLTVTMTMINQKGNGNIVQSFKPNPSSVSFHRPKADMNVASGCPKFAPLSILDDPEFIVDDIVFFQCVINNKGSR